MEIGKAVEEGIVQNLTDAVMGTQTLAEAAISVLNQLKRKLIELAIQRAVAGIGNFIGGGLGNIFGGSGGFKAPPPMKAGFMGTGIPAKLPSGSFNITPKARGGSVKRGSSYLVGERGPELFMPSRSGTIIPNRNIGGGGTTNNMITVNVDASGSSVEGNEQQGRQLGAAISAAIQSELVKQKRSGGLLA